MDVVKTTLEVAEDRDAIRDNLKACKRTLEEYEEYIKQLKDNLEETRSQSNYHAEILEINNYTKTTFNENSKEVKDRIVSIYDYLRQIEETLTTISESEISLNDLYKENSEAFKRIETNFLNNLKQLESTEKDIQEKLLQQRGETEQTIKTIDFENEKCEEQWENTSDEYGEKLKTLQSLKLEAEILEDKIQMELQQQEVLLVEKREINETILQEINDDIEMNEEVLKVEEEISTILEKQKAVLETKEEINQKTVKNENSLKQLEKESSEMETLIKQTEDESAKRIENLIAEIDLKKRTIKEKEAELIFQKNKIGEITHEIEEITAKIVSIDDELVHLQETNKFEDFEASLRKISNENERLAKDSKDLLNRISLNEQENLAHKQELDTLKSIPNSEKLALDEQIKSLEEEIAKIRETEKENEEIDQKGKNLQQSADEHEISLKDRNAQKLQIEKELEENKKKLQRATIECNKIQEQIRRLEALQETVKPFAAPPLKRAPPVKKRQLDLESDSSVDGDRLSYSEFMARKKKLRQKQMK